MFLPSNITLKFGDSGDFVSELQRRLVAVGCFSSDAINGFFDGATVNGVSSFQSMSGIRADGIAGPETLRRLNGVISGDNSSTSDHKAEEEQRLQQEQAMRQQREQQYLYEQQAILAQQQQAEAYAAQVRQQQATAETYAPPAQPQHQPQATLPEVSYAQPAAYQAQQPAYLLQQPAPSAGDDVLARMLLGQQAQAQPQQTATTPNAQQPQPQPLAQQSPQPVQGAAAHALSQPPAIPQPPTNAQPLPAAASMPEIATQQPQAVEPQQRGMIGRAAQFINEKIQQLHNYFEAKLPNHVMNEVKNIGMVMAQSGVKEASIPTEPEPQRGIEGPQRGQQQGQQRG